MTHALCSLANGRVVLALEGGYNIRSISLSAASCASVMLGGAPAPLPASAAPCAEAVETVARVAAVHSAFWSTLRPRHFDPGQYFAPPARERADGSRTVALAPTPAPAPFIQPLRTVLHDFVHFSLVRDLRLQPLVVDKRRVDAVQRALYPRVEGEPSEQPVHIPANGFRRIFCSEDALWNERLVVLLHGWGNVRAALHPLENVVDLDATYLVRASFLECRI